MKRVLLLAALTLSGIVHAEKIAVSKTEVYFDNNENGKQTVDVFNLRPQNTTYFATRIQEVVNPEKGAKSPLVELTDPVTAGLIVTPNKSAIRPHQGQSPVTIVNINPHLEKERVYRVDVKPVVGGVDSVSDAQLKVLLGYDILVHVQPDEPVFTYSVRHDGDDVYLTNTGNTHFVMLDGEQCDSRKRCATLPEWYLYPGVEARIPFDEDKQLARYRLIMRGQEPRNITLNKGGN